MGEVPKFDDLIITHGVCRECHPATVGSAKLNLDHARQLKHIQRQLWHAGHNADLAAARTVIENAIAEGIRPIDMMVGVIAPLLYKVGEDWKSGALSVEGEHRFTAFCEAAFDLIAPRVHTASQGEAPPGNRVLIMNAPGNTHTIAIRLLALWLASKGNRADIVDAKGNTDQLLRTIAATRARVLLISVALSDQYPAVKELARRISEVPQASRPRIVVGGYAVKCGLVPPIRGADLLDDISLLPESF